MRHAPGGQHGKEPDSVILEIDLTNPRPEPRLINPADFGAFHVRALVRGEDPDWEALAEGFADGAHVKRDTDQVYVAPKALARLAGARGRTEDWQQGLAAMLAYAEHKGWLDRGGRIAAHVEWEPEVEPDDFRHVLGHFPTGVAVLTAALPEGPVGMACNSLTSVSLRPPLIAVCPAKRSDTWPEIRKAGRFVVNLMRADHEHVVRAFSHKDIDRFAGVRYHPRSAGPALDDALAWIECSITIEHDAGDHHVVLARVQALEARGDIAPLVFYQGRYGTFGEAST